MHAASPYPGGLGRGRRGAGAQAREDRGTWSVLAQGPGRERRAEEAGSLSSAGPGPPRRLQETITVEQAPPTAGSQDSCPRSFPAAAGDCDGLLRAEQSLSPEPLAGTGGTAVPETWPWGPWAGALGTAGLPQGPGGWRPPTSPEQGSEGPGVTCGICWDSLSCVITSVAVAELRCGLKSLCE